MFYCKKRIFSAFIACICSLIYKNPKMFSFVKRILHTLMLNIICIFLTHRFLTLLNDFQSVMKLGLNKLQCLYHVMDLQPQYMMGKYLPLGVSNDNYFGTLSRFRYSEISLLFVPLNIKELIIFLYLLELFIGRK